MKTIIIAIILSALAGRASASGSKSDPDRAVAMISGAICIYLENHHALPRTWEELRTDQDVAKSLSRIDGIPSLKAYLPFFRFMPVKSDVRLQDGSKVILMSIDDFQRNGPPSLRFIVVQSPDGDIRSYQRSSILLSKDFSSSSYDLADFTGSSGNWQPELGMEPFVAPLNEKRGIRQFSSVAKEILHGRHSAWFSSKHWLIGVVLAVVAAYFLSNAGPSFRNRAFVFLSAAVLFVVVAIVLENMRDQRGLPRSWLHDFLAWAMPVAVLGMVAWMVICRRAKWRVLLGVVLLTLLGLLVVGAVTTPKVIH